MRHFIPFIYEPFIEKVKMNKESSIITIIDIGSSTTLRQNHSNNNDDNLIFAKFKFLLAKWSNL